MIEISVPPGASATDPQSGPATAISRPGETGTATQVAAARPLPLFWRRFRRDKVSVGALGVVALLVVLAVVGGPLAALATGHPPNEPYPELMKNSFGIPKGPNGDFWFGADASARDLFVRTMYGARTSLIVGVAATAIAVAIGLGMGVVAGYYRGWIDLVVSRLIDVMLSLPTILIAIGFVAAAGVGNQGALGGLLKPGLPVVIAVIAFFSWAYVARIVRGVTLSLREMPFVEAQRALGATNRRIIVAEILPHLVGPVIVYSTLLIPTNVLFEASLSFLGLGVPITTPSWGASLSEASQYYEVAWWLMVFPGAFLIMATLAFNLVGDGLRDAADVRASR